MTPEEKARLVIDEKLRQSGWVSGYEKAESFCRTGRCCP